MDGAEGSGTTGQGGGATEQGGTSVQAGASTQEGTAGGKSYTQAEVDALVKGYKDKADKYDAQQEAAKTDLQKAQESAKSYKEKYDALVRQGEIDKVRVKVATEKGVPANLLHGETEEACKAEADALLAFAKNSEAAYPNVNDGGEAGKRGKESPAADFNNWMNAYFG